MACFVDDNHYTVYEVPKKGNTKNSSEYLFLIHNDDFDYWLFGKNYIKISKNIGTPKIKLFATYKPIGMYTISNDSICKKYFGNSITFGGKNSKDHLFDFLNSRLSAYFKNRKRNKKY